MQLLYLHTQYITKTSSETIKNKIKISTNTWESGLKNK